MKFKIQSDSMHLSNQQQINSSQLNIVDEITNETKDDIKRFSIDDFYTIKDLGRGSFGSVKLAVNTFDKLYYAVKCISKEKIKGDKQIQHMLNEKSILKKVSKHLGEESFCVLFYETMQDKDYLYILMEYLPGGELFALIKDLKPENILLDKNGHVKLIDFGFSKQLTDIYKDRTFTNCGTPGYAAPEVMMRVGYSYKADIWSLGILICEMIGGFTPFVGDENMGPQEILDQVRKEQIKMPKNLNNVTRDIIKSILVFDQNLRPEIEEIKSHKFFRGINWEDVKKKKIQPKHIPVNENPEEVYSLVEPKALRSPGKKSVVKVLGDYHLQKINKVFDGF